jgi:hypothetical protein
MAQLTYNGQEVVWLDMSVRVFGSTIVGLRGLKYTMETEKEALYGAGNQILGIQTGNQKMEGTLKVLKNDFDKLNDAAVAAGFTDITNVPYQVTVITVNYKLAYGRPMRTDTLSGVSFSKFEKGMEQNAKNMEIEMPFLFMQLTQS